MFDSYLLETEIKYRQEQLNKLETRLYHENNNREKSRSWLRVLYKLGRRRQPQTDCCYA
ncbi:hypothetical protein ACSVDE_13460 [Pseudalkalibacillus sp. Hm43]|uniref:hypothetical protein n=1 Tax=Pseudalkalibacillus sp. Hm43 TaxID=3450742 RepID=UPI003F41B855